MLQCNFDSYFHVRLLFSTRTGNSIIRNPILVSYVAKGLLPYRGLGSGIKRTLEAWSEIDFIDDRDGCLFIAAVHRKGVKSSGEKGGSPKSSGKTEDRILDLINQDPDDELKHKVDEWSVALSKMNIENRYYTAQLASHKPLFLTGPAYGPDYHKWMIKFKEEFDPDALSNPPGPADTDLFIQEAEWMKDVADWPMPKIEADKNPKFE